MWKKNRQECHTHGTISVEVNKKKSVANIKAADMNAYGSIYPAVEAGERVSR